MIRDILMSDQPSELIRKNKDTVFKIIPELKICDGFNQYNDYHIYDVLEHILHVLDEVENNYILRIAALFHDIGKPNCFTLDEQGIGHFYGHWNESNKIFNKYVEMFDLKQSEINLVNNLIFYHDLNLNENLDERQDVFQDNLYLLLSLKKADILSQSPKYFNRLDDIDNLLINSKKRI